MSDLVFVPSLLKPTFQDAGIKTVEELLSRDIAEFQARRGWRKRKITVLTALQQLYRDAIRGSLHNHNSCISAFVASELLPDTRLGQMMVGDFVNSSRDDWGLRDRGKKDFDGLKRLFATTFNDVSSVAKAETEDLPHLHDSDHPEIDWRDVPPNVAVLVMSDLVFVPSLLKPTFEDAGIRTVEDLLSRDIAEFQSRVGWGERKTTLFAELQHLYSDVIHGSLLDRDSRVDTIITSELLPDSRLGEVTVNDFVNSSGKNWNLEGRRKVDFDGLKRLFVFASATPCQWKRGETQDFSYLQDFEHIEMAWHYVPLNVSKRVTNLLDRYRLVTLRQLDRLVVTSCVCPDTGELLPTLDFGNTSLLSLRNELQELGRYGLEEYRKRHGVVCGLEQLPDPDMDWREVPLRLSKRIIGFLDAFEVRTLAQVYRLSVREEVFCPKRRKPLPALEQKNFSRKSLDQLRGELQLLAELGLDQYRYGKSGAPATAVQLVDSVFRELDERDANILRLRCTGLSLEKVAQRFGITRERTRQIESRALESVSMFATAARDILKPLDEALRPEIVLESGICLRLVGAEFEWQFQMTAAIAGKAYGMLGGKRASLFTNHQVEAIDSLLKEAIRKGTFALEDGEISLRGLVASAAQNKRSTAEIRPLVEHDDVLLTKEQVNRLIGLDWLRAHIRRQLVYKQDGTRNVNVNGVFFEQIETFGLVGSPDEMAQLLGSEAEVLTDGRFRRPGDVYAGADEIIKIVREADQPISTQEIMAKSQQTWHQAALTSRYISPLYEIVQTDRGRYVHIDKLSLTTRDVLRIAEWGADLLAGERKAIDGEYLFDLYKYVDLGLPLENARQLISIVAKHPNVRRLSNNLQLASRDSFDESELFLATTDPDLAEQWHPEKNGRVSPETVRPASFKVYWWRCDMGHEFQAAPVHRTRVNQPCPGCQTRWTITKIRHFVASLQEHLEAFTPAELYAIFQQSGLLHRGGKAKGFVKALTTGRFPKMELEKFVEGQASLVDEFLDDSDLALEDHVLDDERLDKSEEASPDDLEESETDESILPQVRTRKALEALDTPVVASTDAEAAEFLLASAKAKIWSHAYRDESEAIAECEKFGESAYSERVRTEFLEEYRAASKLTIPDGYSFTIDGEIRQPNLMQKHVAVKVRDHRRYGNWSGTGAGKTLSAILATRVVGASLTVVCCPNAVVGDAGDGWAREIRRVFPDSEIITKTLNPAWSGWGRHRYLVLNYEQFQQPYSEATLKQFLEVNDVDFIVVDEIHFTKQRHADQMSQRKRLVQALISAASESNPQLCVLGMSATPVINNLQEGRSLVEMISEVEHEDLDVRPTVPNCMRLHQKLVSLGTRWRPTYDSVLETETVDVDCGEYLDPIRALGKNHSPLELEKILTHARLPVILGRLSHQRQTLVYTHYVQEIDRILYEAIRSAGYRVGFYTGESKAGLNAFKEGKLDVLIGSSAVGTGVDGIQHCCNQLIINVLPWTHSEYEQLIGRVWRQGQTEEKVQVIIPVTFADISGNRWSYCDSKLQRIRYKKSIADAAVDGAVPEGNLRSPAQAQRDILAWLERLEQGQVTAITRRRIIVPLSDDEGETRQRLARYGDFSQLNNRWNRSNSKTLNARLKANPEEWEQYHTLYRQARAQWSVVPVNEMIAWCENREGYEIGDFGCGEALLATAVGDRHVVHSFDHIAIDDSVIDGDMAHTPLDDESLHVAVFSLSLMGDNFTDYIKEAHRVLKIDGHLHIWEATSRFHDVQRFCTSLDRLGFKTFPPEERGQFTYIQAHKTDRQPQSNVELTF